MKKIILLTILISLVGCSYINPTKQTPQQQLCAELKNDIIFSNTPDAPTTTASVTRRTELVRLYEKNRCDKLE
jgi:hypothetical protein